MSATPQELKERIEAGIPGSVVEVIGDGHHFNAVVSAPAFAGLNRIAQHRLVYDVFGTEIDIHPSPDETAHIRSVLLHPQ